MPHPTPHSPSHPVPHRILAVLAVPAAALGALFPPAHAEAPSSYEHQAVTTANEVRTDRGLPALRRAECLARYAERHARRMATRQSLSHQDLRSVQRGCDLSRTAENVAMGYRTGHSVVRQGWMKSPAHRENVLAPGHRLTAVGAVRDRRGRWWTAQLLARP